MPSTLSLLKNSFFSHPVISEAAWAQLWEHNLSLCPLILSYRTPSVHFTHFINGQFTVLCDPLAWIHQIHLALVHTWMSSSLEIIICSLTHPAHFNPLFLLHSLNTYGRAVLYLMKMNKQNSSHSKSPAWESCGQSSCRHLLGRDTHVVPTQKEMIYYKIFEIKINFNCSLFFSILC